MQKKHNRQDADTNQKAEKCEPSADFPLRPDLKLFRQPIDINGSELSAPIRSQAVSWLIYNFVPEFVGSHQPVYSFLPQFADDIMHRETLLGSIAFAVGLAGLCSKAFSPTLLRAAKMQYDKALLKMQKTVEDPIAVVSDQTLLSILLFALYEVCDFVCV